MDQSMANFGKRLSRIEKQHDKKSRGVRAKLDKATGLVTMEPKSSVKMPVRGVALTILGFVLFKSILLWQLGTEPYQQRIDALADGTFVEQAGSFIMQADPLTVRVVELLSSM
ncbi:hypothetical protein [Mesobacterium pallidum]|uniref:hypothetical protein n=1 Tax=Mesobacterium pallidum TaxID=2872037 RepID=UPI001EE25D14|nr:hypothetical protein [Mesobacterium pallidum]